MPSCVNLFQELLKERIVVLVQYKELVKNGLRKTENNKLDVQSTTPLSPSSSFGLKEFFG